MFFFLSKKKISFFVFSLLAFVSGLTKDVSSVVGAPWRCGVLTTQGGVVVIGLGRLLGREHASTPQSGVEAPRLFKTKPREIVLLLLLFLTRSHTTRARKNDARRSEDCRKLPGTELLKNIQISTCEPR